MFIKYCVFFLKFCEFSELCQICCSAGVLPAWCVYTRWHRGKTEKDQSPDYSKIFGKNTIFNEHPVAPTGPRPWDPLIETNLNDTWWKFPLINPLIKRLKKDLYAKLKIFFFGKIIIKKDRKKYRKLTYYYELVGKFIEVFFYRPYLSGTFRFLWLSVEWK